MGLEDIAHQVARGYAGMDGVAAVVIAGSVGRRRCDAFSDVEVDVYWAGPPSEAQRREAVAASGGTEPTIWAYDEDDEEWSDDFRVDGVLVGISGFSVATVEGILGRLRQFLVPDQMRLSALTGGRAVSGAELVQSWRARASYTDDMQRAAVCHYLDRLPAHRWKQADALVAREDWLAVRQLGVESLEATVGLWFALNRTYVEHPRFKWAQLVTPRFAVVPPDAPRRLSDACALPPPEGLDVARRLTLDTLELVCERLPANLAGEALAEMRASR